MITPAVADRLARVTEAAAHALEPGEGQASRFGLVSRVVMALQGRRWGNAETTDLTDKILRLVDGAPVDEPDPWIRRLLASRATSGPALRGLCVLLEADDTAPDALRTLASTVLSLGATVTPSRSTDPATSHKAEPHRVTARNARGKLLRAFAETSAVDGLTDEQAAHRALVSPSSEYAKRCSELREAGLIEPTGEERRGNSGQSRMVSRITEAGRVALVQAGLVEA